MPRTGRPKTDNPRNAHIGLKMTKDEMLRLRDYAARHDMTITQVIQTALERQYQEESVSNQ